MPSSWRKISPPIQQSIKDITIMDVDKLNQWNVSNLAMAFSSLHIQSNTVLLTAFDNWSYSEEPYLKDRPWRYFWKVQICHFGTIHLFWLKIWLGWNGKFPLKCLHKTYYVQNSFPRQLQTSWLHHKYSHDLMTYDLLCTCWRKINFEYSLLSYV